MNKLLKINILLLILLTFSSCEVVEGIFNLGVGVGVFIVIAIIALVIFIISRFKK
ncbi:MULTISPECIES: hypothetical protein [Flavobacterium]|jgi:hypothetical protein|uniref:Phosphatidate cytidylyltransferase n=1 Tax=Flavobacterium lindanitolerans TaxID=428988 RepID=A0A497V173_9FLAO|nr:MULTISPECIES: hypothetical protein [Flavobacterium]MBL7869198.1 hypothetical protein [Flavobacterium lindanitolerans]MBU7569958.1 hypothetical protein [Flavobacterium sp.]PKW20737.1 hypothetical protein B0G92_2013 [Flavobacterium lindanitolerans]RLJ30623.1 hypothetical protein CLV50_2037 [Flavobacterium lindanitolerans]